MSRIERGINRVTFQVAAYQADYDAAQLGQAFPVNQPISQWDQFLLDCPMATWIHSRRFLAYHQVFQPDRFADQSLVIFNSKGKWVGVLPAAVDPSNDKRVVSHPGLSYGGLLHQGALHGEAMLEAFSAVAAYYQSMGFHTLRYKAVPGFYHQHPAQDDLYALFRLNAHRYRCDLSSIIDIARRPKPNQKRRWELQQAVKQGVEVSELNILPNQANEELAEFWRVLEENLSRKHGAKPVHSLKEMIWLHSRFEGNIRFVVAKCNQSILAGLVLFITPMTLHVQYSACSIEGNELFALHPVVEHCIEIATACGCRYFDFGISNERDGQYLNTGLHLFKSKFGSGGALHEFYDLDLSQFEKTGFSLWASDE